MGESWIGGFPVKDKMQNKFVALFTTTPLYDDYGTLAGLICVSMDSRALKMPISNLAPKVSTQLVKSEYSTCWSSFNVNRRSSISICGSGSSSSANNKVEVDKDRLVYEILWEDLTVKESIVEGSCGTVYHAVLYGSDVAVKVFSKQEYSDDLITSFEQEVSLMARLRHPNILLFMGAVTSPQRLCIVTEFLRRGSLFHLLHRNTAKTDWRRRRFQMAIDIAQGVNYLHHCRPPIVHRDLKSPNILIDKNWTVKVGDFGLSRIKHATYLTTTGKGTPQWMAPEVICHEPSNEKSDVYSFGVIMWELATGKVPWDTFDPMEVMAFVGMMYRRLEIPNDVDPQWASIIESCWHRDPASRPTFQELLESLKELQRQHAIHRSATNEKSKLMVGGGSVDKI